MNEHGRIWSKVALHVLAIVVIDFAETSAAKAHAALRRGRALMGIAVHLRLAAEEIGAHAERDAEPDEPPIRDDFGGDKPSVPPTVACGDCGDDERPLYPSFRWPGPRNPGEGVPVPGGEENGPPSRVRCSAVIDMAGG